MATGALTVSLNNPANPPRFQLQCKVQYGLQEQKRGCYLGRIRISMLDETLVDPGQTFLLRKGNECMGIYPSELHSDRVTLFWGEKNAVHISGASQENQTPAAANQAIRDARNVLSENPSIVMEWGQFKKDIAHRIASATSRHFSERSEIWLVEKDADEDGPYTPFVEYVTRVGRQKGQIEASMRSILNRIENPLIVPWTE